MVVIVVTHGGRQVVNKLFLDPGFSTTKNQFIVHTSKILGTMTNYICTIPTIQHSIPMNLDIQVILKIKLSLCTPWTHTEKSRQTVWIILNVYTRLRRMVSCIQQLLSSFGNMEIASCTHWLKYSVGPITSLFTPQTMVSWPSKLEEALLNKPTTTMFFNSKVLR